MWRSYVRMQALLALQLNRQLQSCGELSLTEFEVLAHLSEADDGRLRVLELARSLTWEQSRLSHQLARMERRDLVARASCPEDGRGSFVVLTEPGRETLVGAAPSHVEEVRRLLFEPLTTSQVRAFGAVCDAVLARLEAECGGEGVR